MCCEATITKRAVAWVGSVQPECTIPLNTRSHRNFKPEFLVNGKRLRLELSLPLSLAHSDDPYENACEDANTLKIEDEDPDSEV